MRVEVSWYDDEKTVILQQFPAEWTWDDYYDGVKRTVELEKTVDHHVYVVGTQPPNGQTPKGNILTHYNAAIKMHADNMRYFIIATDNTMTTFFGNIFLKTTPMRTKARMVTTIEDAINFVEQDKEKTVA